MALLDHSSMPMQHILLLRPHAVADSTFVAQRTRLSVQSECTRLGRASCGRKGCASLSVLAMGGLGSWAKRGSRRRSHCIGTRASAEEVNEEAAPPSAAEAALKRMGAPPHWLIIHTGTTDHSVAKEQMDNIRAFSAEVPLRQAEVQHWTYDGKVCAKSTAWHMAVAVPSKTMLLVSSLIAETHQADDEPLFVENLDVDGNPEFYLATLKGYGDEDRLDNLEESAMDILRGGYAASVDVDEDMDRLQFVTTATGKSGMEKETDVSYGQ